MRPSILFDAAWRRALVPALAPGLALAGSLAQPCDHRFGADATWSHNTDQAKTDSFYYAEACAFRFNLPVTVFLSPFDGRGSLDETALRAAADTGRVSFEVYFQTDRWHEPGAAEPFPRIPDYYPTQWSRAGLDAGFEAAPGAEKRTRYPNHGAQLFEVSKGRYGYDTAGGQAGAIDALTALAERHREWIHEVFGYYPAAAAYRNGQTGAAYAMPQFFLGVRNSAQNGDTAYGRSTERGGWLGTARAMGLRERASHPSTTRAGDMDASTETVLAHCAGLLREAMAAGGWYRDFIHWHTNPRFETTLHDYFASQRAVLDEGRVAAQGHGQALQHLVLRDLADVTAQEDGETIALQVAYRDPGGDLPLESIRISLSVRIDLAGTRLSGADIRVPGAAGVRKLGEDLFIVEVPFPGRGRTVRLAVQRAQSPPGYEDDALPVVRRILREENTLLLETDRPTRLALFGLPADVHLAAYLPRIEDPGAPGSPKAPAPERVECMGRSNTPARSHRIDIPPGQGTTAGHWLIGLITEQGQSILVEME